MLAANPRSPGWGGQVGRGADRHNTISIHAPREGSGVYEGAGIVADAVFLSTLPGRGAALRAALWRTNDHGISIHAPREGSGGRPPRPGAYSVDFYPRSPGGERPTPRGFRRPVLDISIHAPREGSGVAGKRAGLKHEAFLSTLPGRGAATAIAGRPTPMGFLSTLPGRGAAIRS